MQKLLQNILYTSIQKKLENRKPVISGQHPPLSALVSEKDATLYVHFPFCDIACTYCRFSKNINKKNVAEYCEAVLKEIDLFNIAYGDKKQKVHSIFLGGGTPSLMPLTYLEQIVDRIKSVFQCTDVIQITLECHPQSLQEDSLQQFLDIGITRLSIGVQSFREDVLKEMGRPIDAPYIKTILSSLQKQKFYNYNIDLMYGFDCQTEKQFLEDIRLAIQFETGHITIYPLIKPPGQMNKALFVKQANMYKAAQALLIQHGYVQYSVEDFTRNDAYKLNYQIDAWGAPPKEHILLGSSVFGTLGEFFHQKESNIQKYIDLVHEGEWPVKFTTELQGKKHHLLKIVFGLHYNLVDRREYKKQYGIDPVAAFPLFMLLLRISGIISISRNHIILKEDQYFRASQLWGRVLFNLL